MNLTSPMLDERPSSRPCPRCEEHEIHPSPNPSLGTWVFPGMCMVCQHKDAWKRDEEKCRRAFTYLMKVKSGISRVERENLERRGIQLRPELLEYVDLFMRGIPPRILFLYGTFGTGKTAAFHAVVRDIYQAHVVKEVTRQNPEYHAPDVLMMKLQDVYDLMHDYKEMKSLKEKMESVKLLCIDEIGRGNPEKMQVISRVQSVLQTRFDQGKPTVLISNSSLDDLYSEDSLFSGAYADRLSVSMNDSTLIKFTKPWREINRLSDQSKGGVR